MIWELRHEHKVGLLIDIAGIPRSTYYYYSKQFENPKPDKYAEIKEEIRQIYNDSKGRYGYRRITKELQKTHKINHKTVQRLMRKMGIFCRVRMKKYNSFRGEAGRTAPNLLERNFKTDAPNQKWVTDVTEFSLFGTKLYLSPCQNSRRYRIDSAFRSRLAVSAQALPENVERQRRSAEYVEKRKLSGQCLC